MEKKVTPSFFEASSLLVVIISIIAVSVIGLEISPNIAVLVAMLVIMLYGWVKKYPFEWFHEGIIKGVTPGIVPIFIFLLVGALIAVWIQAGIIPSLMVYGFDLIRVEWFVPSIFVVCAIVGSAVGSAFTVMSTIGIAFFGIGQTLGLAPGLVVGAIVSGAVFGDKISPLSESTNLAAAIVGADLFKHIKQLMWSTVPAFIGSLLLFSLIGHGAKETDMTQIQEVTQVLKSHFSVSVWSLLPLMLMLFCAWKKLPAIMTILLNIVVAILMVQLQKPVSLQQLATVIDTGYVSHTGNELMDSLLSRGGMSSMLPTVGLIILTLSLGGLLVEFGLISTVMEKVAQKMTSDAKLIITTLFTSMGVNLFIGEQFLSVILPGSAFKETYAKAGLEATVLSRTLEDGGTVINYLVPWGIAGSFVASTFGVSTLTYLPFAFFSLLSPLFSIISAITGIGVKKIPQHEQLIERLS